MEQRNLKADSWKVEDSEKLTDFLRPLVEKKSAKPLDAVVKVAIPSFKKFASATLNSKVGQFWHRLGRDIGYDPDEAEHVTDEFDAANDAVFNSFGTQAYRDYVNNQPAVRQSPAPSQPPRQPTALTPVTSLSSTTALANPPSSVHALTYTPIGVRLGRLTNEIWLHDMWSYYDPKISLRLLDIMLRILPDMEWETLVSADVGFVDPENRTIENPATAAIVKYFSGESGTEPFKYLIELPEAIDSNVRSDSFDVVLLFNKRWL
ncbi:hypothetical protein BDR26DRAFT_892757 [Obelidium mucronatum]|nr:hypothetical protein BDR26DRAFT_892757 [Obelidium mucronatum]